MMGKKRATSVRRIGETLIKLHPNSFTSDFEENKKIISDMVQFPSISARNKVAGYITRVFMSSSMGVSQEQSQPEESQDEAKTSNTQTNG